MLYLFKESIWKVYETDGRGRLHILFQSNVEEKIFSYLYQLLRVSTSKNEKAGFNFGSNKFPFMR